MARTSIPCCAGPCRQGRDACPTPEACCLPEPGRTFRPTFGIEGPFLPTTRAGWGRVLITACAIAGAFFIAGALGKHVGLF